MGSTAHETAGEAIRSQLSTRRSWQAATVSPLMENNPLGSSDRRAENHRRSLKETCGDAVEAAQCSSVDRGRGPSHLSLPLEVRAVHDAPEMLRVREVVEGHDGFHIGPNLLPAVVNDRENHGE